MKTLSRSIGLIVAGFCLAFAASPGGAQNYPSKPVRWILGFPAGGTSDLVGREIAPRLTKLWGQQVIVDNRPGASGIIANSLGAAAPPDGYTMLLISSTFANLIAMNKKVPYDPYRSFVPVTVIAEVPNILSVHPSLPVKSVKDLVALAKARPGDINYGTGGALTGPHLATELFRLKTGINIVHIPYKGTPNAVTDLIAGRVPVMFALTPVVLPHIRSGKVRGIAVSGSKRIPDLPELPTVAETIAGYEATVWYGLLMPRGTPPAIINKLNRDFHKVLSMPDVIKRLGSVGFLVHVSTPEGLVQFIKSNAEKWTKVIHDAHIPVR